MRFTDKYTTERVAEPDARARDNGTAGGATERHGADGALTMQLSHDERPEAQSNITTNGGFR